MSEIYLLAGNQIQHLAELIGHFIAAVPEVWFGTVFVKRLDILKNQALSVSHGNFSEIAQISDSVRISSGGLTICSLLLTLLKLIFLPSLFTRKLLKQVWGGGVVSYLVSWCFEPRVGGECNGVTTGGPWTEAKSEMHIHCLELKAALFALNRFVEIV